MVDDATRTVALGSRLAYGYGVHVVPVDGHPTYGHTGRYLGARNVFRYFPLEGVTIAVMTNQSRADPSDLLVNLLRVPSIVFAINKRIIPRVEKLFQVGVGFL